MSTKSRERIYGTTIRMSAERAKEARQEADRARVCGVDHRMLATGDLRNLRRPWVTR